MRLVFFAGFFGSDEVTYLQSALATLQGNWPRNDYVGALRFGINLPVAAFLGVFGVNVPAAAAWAFLGSLGEVAVAYSAARYLAGARVALLSALILAVLPLHVHLAGRLMADPPLALFITLTFVLFKLGQDRNSSLLFFLAGLAAGFVFWIKEAAVIFLAGFVLYPILFRTWRQRWAWMIAGSALMFVVNCLMFWVLTGDFLHVLTATSLNKEKFLALVGAASSPLYYLRYLFLDLRHTWLLGPLAFIAVLLLARRWVRGESHDAGMRYVVFWAVSLLVVFSFTVVSANPFKLIMKQTNYMTIFAAPLAILAGWLLSTLSRPALLGATTAMVIGSVILSALQQQAVEVFTANSKAAVQFAREHRDAKVFGTVNAQTAGIFFEQLIHNRSVEGPRIVQPLDELIGRRAESAGSTASGDQRRFAVVDLQTLQWGDNGISTMAEVPACWRQMEPLVPAREGAGRWVSERLSAMLAGLGGSAAKLVSGLTEIRPAWVYEVPEDCKPGESYDIPDRRDRGKASATESN